ncbi:Major Facilitator Superfamily protein [compost metagenome]
MTPQYLAALNNLSPENIGFVLFPAAIVSAMLGRRGGKLADERGNGFLMSAAACLMLVCYALLSSFVGVTPYIIAVILIAGNVGQTFMQITMSNTISRTLAKEQVGVGMGLFSMLNFISGAISMSIISKLLDQQQSALRINPFVANEGAYVYSNIFIVMCLMVAAMYWLYRVQFGSAKAKL